MTTTSPVPEKPTTPDVETDNWESAAADAPRQQAGDVIERASHDADKAGAGDAAAEVDNARLAADAEALAERQAAGEHDPAAGAA